MDPQMTTTIIWIVAMFAMFYLLFYLPESKRKKKFNSMISSLKVNDEIVTRGGIVGKIINIQDEFIILQTGPDKGKVKITKNAVADIISKKEEIKK